VEVEVLKAVTLNIAVFWDGMMCNLKMEAVDLSGRSIHIYFPDISAASILRLHSIPYTECFKKSSLYIPD
jgi:hypothetical protein